MKTIEIQYTGGEPLGEVSKERNPTLGLTSPDFGGLRKRVYDLVIDRDGDLFRSLDRALAFSAQDYLVPKQPDETDANIAPTLTLCQLGRQVGVYHTGYQQIFLRVHGQLDNEVRIVVQQVFLYLLKKMEWIAKRDQSQTEDTYFKCYYSTLRRYKDVALGRIIFDGKWIAITEIPIPVVGGTDRLQPTVDFSREQATFIDKLPELLRTQAGCFVAIKHEQVLDRDKDQIALAKRVWSKKDGNILIRQVVPHATVEKWHIATPLKERDSYRTQV